MGLLYPGYISSQESPYVFRQIGVVEGLPDNYVKSVFPIPDGRIGVRSTVLLSLYEMVRTIQISLSIFMANIR